MAPGYVIALALEAAGLLGLGLGLLRMRAERRARAAGLSGVLRTGGAAARRIPAPALRIVALPATERAPGGASTARAALHRAVAPPIAA